MCSNGVDMLLGLRVDVVREVVCGHDHGDNRQTWEGYNPPGGGNEVAAIGNDQAPLGDWWRCAVAQKDRKSTRLNSSHVSISYAVFCLKKKIIQDMSV